jgi:hypothetical protein
LEGVVLRMAEVQFVPSFKVDGTRIGIEKSAHVCENSFKKKVEVPDGIDIQTDLCDKFDLFFFSQHGHINLSFFPY